MIISDGTLKRLLSSQEIVCDPLSPHAIQPASLDCCLGNHFLLPDTTALGMVDIDQKIPYKEFVGDSIVMPAHSFLLATTKEYFKIPNTISAFVEGRSSVGRMGLFVQNAGWIDPGFEGCITLELYNATDVPMRLTAGRRICQIVFCFLDQPVESPYRGKYQGQKLAVGSRVTQDPECGE